MFYQIFKPLKTKNNMLYYQFDNYLEFQACFGIMEHGNGEKSRKNKILLAYLKNKDLLHQARITNDYSLLHISSMSQLKEVMTQRVIESGQDKKYPVQLINTTYHSDIYETDNMEGLCEDGDNKSVRYINHNNGKVYKMKAGKLLRALILETEFGQTLPEQVLGYLCEEFTQEWQTYCMGAMPKNQLTVSQEFKKIYSSGCCEGDFHSCMVDRDLDSFYSVSVDASAAYLTNEKGRIIARCIIYNKCYDEDGKVWRLAERQYSSDCNDVLKRALIDSLIREGHIDGYKKVGAGCCDASEFVDIEGKSLSDKRFYIDCNLETYDTLSYQDSFKWYDIDQRRAYNHSELLYHYCLDTTEGSIDGDCDDDEDDEDELNYDQYHNCNTANGLVNVLVDGHIITCDEERLDDFTWVEEEQRYVHNNEVSDCEECGKAYISEHGFYSTLLDEEFCCEKCREKAENTYKEENWFWSEYDGKYFEDENALTELYRWSPKDKDYSACTISRESLDMLIERKEAFIFEDEAYDTINKRTGKPFFYYRKRIAA